MTKEEGEDSSAPYVNWSKEQLIQHIQSLEGGREGSTNPSQKKKQPQRPFDHTTRHYRYIALKIAYLGYDYFGLAAQPTDKVETIESVLFQALRRTRLVPEGEPPKTWSYSRCGRTDRGVSSFGQVIGLYVRSELSTESLNGEATGVVPWSRVVCDTPPTSGHSHKRKLSPDQDDDYGEDNVYIMSSTDAVTTDEEGIAAAPLSETIINAELDYVSLLNRVLPPDIRVLSWSPVPTSFDARFSCTQRRYKYFFVRNALNIEAMKEGARKLCGVDLDYRNFCKPDFSKTKTMTTFRRSIFETSICPESSCDPESPSAIYSFQVVGSAFLWHQVRCMMAVLLRIGQGLERPQVIDDLLNVPSLHPGKVGRPTYEIASEIPLSLVECIYPFSTTRFQWICGPKTRVSLSLSIRQRQDELRIRLAHLDALLGEILPAMHTEENREDGELTQAAMLHYGSNVVVKETSDPLKYVPLMERKRCASLAPFIKLKDV